MNALCNAIIENNNKKRTNLLAKHTSDAVRLNMRGSKIRIRRLLKIIDKYFWSEEENKRSNNRINNLLYDWLGKFRKNLKTIFKNTTKKDIEKNYLQFLI